MNDEKIAKWQAVVDTSPDDELARFTLARAFFDAGRLEAACEHFEEALRLKPDWMMAWILLGRGRMDLDDGVAARAALTKARVLAEAQGHEDPILEINELLEELMEAEA